MPVFSLYLFKIVQIVRFAIKKLTVFLRFRTKNYLINSHAISIFCYEIFDLMFKTCIVTPKIDKIYN